MAQKITPGEIEKTVDQLMENRFLHLPSFALDEMASAVAAACGAEDREMAERVMWRVLQTRNDLFLNEGTAYPKALFFKDMQFRVTLSPAELEKAVVFPGASFIPFVTEEIFADEFTMTDEESGETLPVINVTAKYAELLPAFYLLGNSGMIDHLSAESEENRQQLWRTRNPENLEMQLSAFDFSEFFREYSVTENDALLVTVRDWEKAKFSVRVQRGDVAEDVRSSFIRDLEGALLQVCETEKDYLEIPHQIAEAYLFAFIGGHDLRRRPDVSMSEYYLRMNEIGIRRDGSEWLLVPAEELDTPGTFEQSLLKKRAEQECQCGHDHDHQHGECQCGHEHSKHDGKPERTLDPDLDVNNFTVSTGTLESLDAILEELNAPVNSIELDAMINDALANGEEDFNSFYARLMASMKFSFADEAQETAFLNFLEDNWEVCREYFNPAEDMDVRAPLRTRLLDLTNARIEYSMTLLERNGKIPEKTVKRLAAIHQGILDTLSLLNRDTRLQEQYEQLDLRVSDIEEAWDDFMASGGD